MHHQEFTKTSGWPSINIGDSEKGKKHSIIGKEGRSKLQMNHTAGRKSFARIRDIKTKKRGGLVPSRAEIFRITHTKKNKQPVDLKSAQVMDELYVVELEQQSDIYGPQPTRSAASRNDSLSQVLREDCHGHVRTFGLGPSPSDIYGPQPTRMEYKRMASHAIKTSEERVHVIEEKMLSMQAAIDKLMETLKSMSSDATQGGQSHGISVVNSVPAAEISNLNSPLDRLVHDKDPIPREQTKSIAGEFVQRTSTSRFSKRVLPPDLTESNHSFEPTSTTNLHPISDPNISTMQRKHSKEQTHFAQGSSSRLKHSHMLQKPLLKRQKRVEGKNTKVVRVNLMNFGSPKEVVAQGRIMSRDPNKEVGGFKLGPYFWEVYVEVAIKEQEFLIRPRDHFSTMKEAVGSTIAWPFTKLECEGLSILML